MSQTLNDVMRSFYMFVRNQHQVDFQAGLNLGDICALLIQEEGGHFHGHLRMDGCGVLFHGLFLQQAQNVQRAGLSITNDAGAIAAWACDVRAFA